jgi:two-component system response regulator VicR
MTTPLHILVADDESDIRELVQFILQATGFRVSTSESAAEVLRLVRTERFDALLLDYWMREATGVELCRQIRTFDQSTPILICSGAVSEADRKAATVAGAQGYLEKPFVPDDLIRALRSLGIELRSPSFLRSFACQLFSSFFYSQQHAPFHDEVSWFVNYSPQKEIEQWIPQIRFVVTL